MAEKLSKDTREKLLKIKTLIEEILNESPSDDSNDYFCPEDCILSQEALEFYNNKVEKWHEDHDKQISEAILADNERYELFNVKDNLSPA